MSSGRRHSKVSRNIERVLEALREGRTVLVVGDDAYYREVLYHVEKAGLDVSMVTREKPEESGFGVLRQHPRDGES